MNRQAAADPVKSLWERILGWLPGWLGFVLIILAGITAIVMGAISSTPSAGLIAFGVAAIVSSVLAWWSGAKSEPRVNPFEPSFGGVVSRVEQWVTLVVIGLFVVALIIAFVTRP